MTIDFTQDTRQLRINTPLGEDVLLVASLDGVEKISSLFRFDLELYSTKPDVSFDEIVGENVTVSLRAGDQDRHFNGLVRQFRQLETSLALTRYHAEIVPWLWYLTQTTQCRIFQNLSVKEIVAQVFDEFGVAEFRFELEGTYPKREYCVQYRETDYQFVSRLLEEEGIHFYFAHEDGKHTLVLVDAPAKNPACAVNPEARFNVEGLSFVGAEAVTSLSWQKEVRPTKVSLRNFNFTTPKAPFDGEREEALPYGELALFDYSGPFPDANEANRYAKVRLEEQAARAVRYLGTSHCRGFVPGCKFDLKEHPRADLNQALLLLEVRHRASEAGGFQPGRSSETMYENSFVAMPHATPFRPSRRTPRPRIGGTQTAIVVGPDGEEIHTDQYGRVKVRFHWDYAKADKEENRSCWVRVSQGWAGKNWGIFFLPRLGQEVIVDFLEGDPDQPLITGCVYNAESMPPYALPANKTMSGIKSRSSKDAGTDMLNTIRFEDKKDEEQLFVQAQRNFDVRVKNDSLEWVGNNRHLVVKTDRKEKIENDAHLAVTRDLVVKVGRDEHHTIEGKQALKTTGSRSLTVADDVIEVFEKNHSEQVTSDYYLKATNLVIEGSTNVTIKVGQSFIAIESGGIKIGTTGEIVLDATSNITQTAVGNVEISATGSAKLEGTAGLELSSPAISQLKGSMVKIN